jgi:hypothetical protein
VRAARERGLKIWMAYGLFDNGSGPDVGFSGFPYAAEDRLRVDHPEYAPVNRWGTWRQGGPLELAYPGARKGMVDYLAKYTREGGYDGIAFLTYAENYSQRYDDEFGFSPPIVGEFKRRHGVDIRTQEFDRKAWSRLRGEYLTQFFRELRAALGKNGPKVGVCVDGRDPELPTLWGDTGMRTAGTIHMDVAAWAKEGLVDEVVVGAPPDDAARAVERCRELCRGTATVAAAMRTRGPLAPGTPRVMFLGGDFENGYRWESWIGFKDENIPRQPADALSAGDAIARRRLLTAVLKKKQKLPPAEVARATKDPDLYVRRLALRALAAGGDASAAPAVEAALRDPEHSVRLQAAVALADVAGGRCAGPLFEAVAREPASYQLLFRAVPQALKQARASGQLTDGDRKAILAHVKHAEPMVREAALFALLQVGAPPSPETDGLLADAARDDPDPYVHEMALDNLRSLSGPSPLLRAAAYGALHDEDAAVGVRAMIVLARSHGPLAPSPVRAKVLQRAVALFRAYGDGCKRADRDWGWRLAGEALLAFGPDGEQALHASLKDSKDRRLAEIAWRVLYLKQGDQYHRLTEADDRAAHKLHPRSGGSGNDDPGRRE